MLNMLGHFGFTPALDRLAQTGYSETGGEGGAETAIVDEVEGALFTGDAA